MIELNSIFVVLLVEALGGLTLLVFGFLLFSKKKSAGGVAAADELITKLEDTENSKVKKLGELITENCSIGQDEMEAVLGEITQSERELYKKIIQMFLNRDTEILQGIDQYIDKLSDPYCKLLSYSTADTADNEKLKVAENKIHRLVEESKRVAEQLSLAMNTMDEISAEYTRVFSGTQTELELENSRKTMFKIFHNAGRKIKDTFKDQEAKEI